ncbi:hypothetical protein C8R44DRAFT_832337 [Mycena epipterygia]|nr:hypothetical protein C8R44DRAFT_832337 [Mycena epipterygia]
MEFSPRAKIRWVAQGGGLYECQFLTMDTHALPVENLPDVRHPSKHYLWQLVGRIDDVIVHSSGEKTVPVPMEDIIMNDPQIKGVVIFGARHSQPGVLVELFDVGIDSEDSFQEANEDAPAFSKIYKDMILFSKPNRHLPRSAGKWNVVRKAALAAYEIEIEQLYQTIESTTERERITPPYSWEESNVFQWLLVQAADINPTSLSPSCDLFEQGLSTTILRRRITAAFHSSKIAGVGHISQDIVYRHPTLVNLANILAGLVVDSERQEGISEAERMAKMVERYSCADGILPRIVVLLTGSTGNLGAGVLARLLLHDQVDLVYAFNRPSKTDGSMVSRHQQRFKEKGLNLALLESDKIVFLEGETAEHQLGTVTIIIHVAWWLNFNLSLQSFESSIRGTQNLIKMAQAARNASSLRFVFTSSTSSVQAWDAVDGPVPEEIVHDPSVAIGTGYGGSKFVVEKMLSTSGLHACSFRIGQMSGDLGNDVWPATEWFPMLVQVSLNLGAMPDARGRLVDVVAQSIREIALTREALPPVLNVVHPRPIAWSSMISILRDALIEAKSVAPDALQLLPFQHWLKLLEKCQDSNLPALKLLAFFRDMSQRDAHVGGAATESAGMPSFDTTKIIGISSIIRTLSSITTLEIERWVEGWIAAGF